MNYNDAIMRYSFADVGDEYLSHHGIKGQKWGIRRFQNPDGTLTAAGKARYITDDGHLTDAGRKQYKKDIKRLKKLKDRANVDVQKANIEKYDKRADIAKKVGLGSLAVAGTMAGVPLIKNLAINRHDANANAYNKAIDSWQDAISFKSKKLYNPNREFPSFDEYQQLNDNIKRAKDTMRNASARVDRENGVLFNVSEFASTIEKGTKIVGAAAGATAAVAGATYAYNKLQSRLAKNRLTDEGHQKAVANVNECMDYMKKVYGDVKLDDLYKRNSK